MLENSKGSRPGLQATQCSGPVQPGFPEPRVRLLGDPCPRPLPEPKDWVHAGHCVLAKRRRRPQGSSVVGGRWSWGPGAVCLRVDATAEKPPGVRGRSWTPVLQLHSHRAGAAPGPGVRLQGFPTTCRGGLRREEAEAQGHTAPPRAAGPRAGGAAARREAHLGGGLVGPGWAGVFVI